MFGYVIPNQKELKVRELEEYRGWYCGLCHRLQREYGLRGRLSLNYDMTFLGLLLSSLYDTERVQRQGGCPAHPFRKQISYDTPYVGYAADMNLLLTYYKCLDDWRDDRNIIRGSYGAVLRSTVRRLEKKYPDKASLIRSCLSELGEAEHRKSSGLDEVSGSFGRLCGGIFAYAEDIWHQELWHMGFYLGKFIYLLDAWDDLERDYQTGSYNPLLFMLPVSASGAELRKPELEQKVFEILTRMMAEACRYFERLPVVEYGPLLRNILYSGVWTRFYQIRQDSIEKNDRSE